MLKSKNVTVEQGFEYDTNAGKLAFHTCEVLRGVLEDNFWNLDTPTHTQFRTGLEEFFVSALKLKTQTCLDPSSFRFQWPRADEAYDSTTMDVGADGFSKSTHRVRLALFPALLQVDQGVHKAL